MVSNETYLPSMEELTVPVELAVSMPTMKAAAVYMGKACEDHCKEFMLCRSEEEDPRKCLKEGAAVTDCGVRFLQQMKKHCRRPFEQYAHCIDDGHQKNYISLCRGHQRQLDQCTMEKLGLERPKLGYFSRLHVHQSARPQPSVQMRNYQQEAQSVIDDLPKDYPVRDDFRRYTEGRRDYLAP